MGLSNARATGTLKGPLAEITLPLNPPVELPGRRNLRYLSWCWLVLATFIGVFPARFARRPLELHTEGRCPRRRSTSAPLENSVFFFQI